MSGIQATREPSRARHQGTLPREVAGNETGRIAERLANLARQRPVLVVLCGPSHSGKSTFAGALRGQFVVVNSDTVRQRTTGAPAPSQNEEAVWRTFEYLKRQALGVGRNVVLDACHLSRQARWHSLQGARGWWKVCVLFDVPWGVIRARCRRTGRLSLAEARRMWRAFRAAKPTPQGLLREGYHEVHVVRAPRSCWPRVSVWRDQRGAERPALGRASHRRAAPVRATRHRPPCAKSPPSVCPSSLILRVGRQADRWEMPVDGASGRTEMARSGPEKTRR